MSPFANEELLELRRADVRGTLVDALGELERRLPLSVPVLVGGDRRPGEDLTSTDPGRPERVVALAACAGEGDVDEAVRQARAAARTWAARPASDRAEVLRRAAAGLRTRRRELAALVLRECAKPWAEADADVAEAIDFLEYYARAAVELERNPPALEQAPGERNEMLYKGRGVVAVIAPWNFPLAIPAGMVGAALATGNAVVLKPAEQSPGCAGELVGELHRAGVPPGVLGLLPGAGETGASLVSHPGVHTIAFTGSNAVGLEIIAAAARTPPEQHHLKRVVAEMGGKNCVIVDADADLDEAIPAIVRSAFAYAGQKCSAAARVLVCEGIADALVERLSGAVATLEVGPAERFGIDVPAVIERAARERVEGFIADGSRDGSVCAQAGPLPPEGHYCAPTLLTNLPGQSRLLHDEIFGPVLTVERVRDVDHACDLVDAARFALTGGLFSRNPVTVAHVSRRTPVGNLYVNREITGAMVGRQPFGGNRLSGTGTKAGGPDYLLAFVEPRVVSENVTRHGLVV